MQYIEARLRKESEDKIYRIYVTDCLKFIAENTARYAGGSAFTKRYSDLIERKRQETRTSEEVIDTIRSKLKELE